MGTTLTGTTPQDTYESLIKVTDNGPLSGTAKYLSDGLGNDSVLALSTTAVGVGTSSPAQLLTLQNGNVDNVSGSRLRMNMGPNPYWELQANNGGVAADRKFVINTSAAAGDVLTLTQAGNVGIGTSAPAYKLQLNASGGNGISLIGDVDNEASVLFGDSGSAVIGRLTYSNIDDSMRIFTNGTEKVRITSTGALLVGTTTAPTVNTGTVAVIGSSVIHSGTLNFPSPYSQNIQIDIVYTNWGSNNVIGLVDIMVTHRQFGVTSGAAFGKVFATNGAGAAFNSFNTTDVTTSQCTITAASGGNYTLRITIDPSNIVDLGSYYLNIPTGGGVNVSSISVTLV